MRNFFKQAVDWVEKRLTIIKIVFVFSVLIFVIREVGKILKEISGAEVSASFQSQSPLTLLIMLVVGFIAVTPMLVYDFTIVEFLPGTFKKSYIVRSGWTVNTFTNIAGFGGILGASLRANFYSKGATRKEVIYAISKIALFLVSGLSLYSLVSLVMIFGFGIGPQYAQYWPWLLIGGLYFPAIFIYTRLNNGEFFADLTLSREIKLITGSLLEWGACVGFFILIGVLMGQHIAFLAVFPLFVVASLAGEVSLVPGGLGAFDVFMIFGLGFIGVSRSDAVVWLLLYRIFYYILPFLVGVIFFFSDTGARINERLDGLPKQIMGRVSQGFLTIFMYFSGIMLLLFATIPNVVLTNKLYLQFFPYTFFFLDEFSNIIVAFLLIGLARGIGARVKRAFWPTVVVLIGAIVNTLWKENFPVEVAILLGIVLIAVWFSRSALYREHFEYSWGAMLTDAAVFAGTFILYTLVGLYTTKAIHPHHPNHFTKALLFPSAQIWFAGLIALIVAFLIVALIIWYLARNDAPFLKAPFDKDRMAKLISEKGGNEVSHLAYLKDKSVYYYQAEGEDQIAFLFRKRANKLIIMGEPFGDQAYLQEALDDFMGTADRYSYSLVFYEISQALTMQLHEMGFDFIKAGEEGIVDLPAFTLEGKKRRGERALMNKFEREDYRFEMLQPPFSPDVMVELKQVSDSWLGDQVEKGFSLGFFDPEYLNQAPIAVIKNAQGEIVAFASVMPMGGKQMASIDLMRSSHEAPSGIMDGLFISLFKYNLEQGYTQFDLGMTPLANVGVSRYSFTEERISHLIYKYGYNFYSFQGLRSYKEKYVTEWQPKYIAYRKRSSLIFTMLQILLVVNERSTSKKNDVPPFLKRFTARVID